VLVTKRNQTDTDPSSTGAADPNPWVSHRVANMPYGADRPNSTAGGFTPKYQFNFKELESATGCYDYGARMYNPVSGRFLSADTSSADGYNRFAYVRNNPVRYGDPTGHQAEPKSIPERLWAYLTGESQKAVKGHSPGFAEWNSKLKNRGRVPKMVGQGVIVFRGSREKPEVVFVQGFSPRGSGNPELSIAEGAALHTAQRYPNSPFVSTTTSAEWAEHFAKSVFAGGASHGERGGTVYIVVLHKDDLPHLRSTDQLREAEPDAFRAIMMLEKPVTVLHMQSEAEILIWGGINGAHILGAYSPDREEASRKAWPSGEGWTIKDKPITLQLNPNYGREH
jgi:RHS repeat-associated protein